MLLLFIQKLHHPVLDGYHLRSSIGVHFHLLRLIQKNDRCPVEEWETVVAVTISFITLNLRFGSKLNGRTDSSQHAFIVSDVFACDVKGRSMVYRGADNTAFETYCNVHTLFNTHNFDRCMSLVVITSNNDIKIATTGTEE